MRHELRISVNSAATNQKLDQACTTRQEEAQKGSADPRGREPRGQEDPRPAAAAKGRRRSTHSTAEGKKHGQQAEQPEANGATEATRQGDDGDGAGGEAEQKQAGTERGRPGDGGSYLCWTLTFIKSLATLAGLTWCLLECGA